MTVSTSEARVNSTSVRWAAAPNGDEGVEGVGDSVLVRSQREELRSGGVRGVDDSWRAKRRDGCQGASG